jgi:hypothetical protein
MRQLLHGLECVVVASHPSVGHHVCDSFWFRDAHTTFRSARKARLVAIGFFATNSWLEAIKQEK